MKRLCEVKINAERFDHLLSEAQRFSDTNPACKLAHYWSDRMNHQVEKKLRETGELPYGYVGDGWPHKSDQSWALTHDTFGFSEAFGDHHYRDVGDAIYQANSIFSHLQMPVGGRKLKLLDFGAGYGRLAIPFIHKLRGSIVYFGIDAVPISLMIAPQFVKEFVNANVAGWDKHTKTFDKFDFISLPAWRMNEIENEKFDAFISVHSFQEMTREAVEFYISFAAKHAVAGAFLYSINLWPEEKYVPDSWRLIYDRDYPINRDGSFNEKIWVIE